MGLKPSDAERLRDAADALEDARRERDLAVVDAWRAGGGIAEIGRLVRLDHTSVGRLLERMGVRERRMDRDAAARELDRRNRQRRGLS